MQAVRPKAVADKEMPLSSRRVRLGIMAKDRVEELWAAAWIEAALPGVAARQHDDGSRASMHDLDLFRGADRFGACEITSVADPEGIALWKLVNDRDERWIEPDLQGGWMLMLSPGCRAKKLKAGLRELLRAIESQGVKEAGRGRRGLGQFEPALNDLGIIHAFQSDTEYPGSIYFTIEFPIERTGGFVSETGDELADWLNQWASTPEQEHNVTKLINSRAHERHLFVLFHTFAPVPFPVTDILMRSNGPLPSAQLDLPDGITHLWTASLWSTGHLFAWNESGGWSRHSKDVSF